MPAGQLCPEQRRAAGDSQHPCERQEHFDSYASISLKTPNKVQRQEGKNPQTRLLFREMLKDHIN